MFFSALVHIYEGSIKPLFRSRAHIKAQKSLLVLKIHFKVMFPTTHNITSCLFLLDYSTKTLYAPLLSPTHDIWPAHLILFDLTPEKYFVTSTDQFPHLGMIFW
jgi:hypothetical protein